MAATGKEVPPSPPQNYAKAFGHFREAAELDIVEAQYNLGVCYEKGRGTAIDIEQAHVWYAKAAAQGFERAIAKLDSKPKIATPSQATSTIAENPDNNAPTTTTKLRSVDWLKQQATDKFALQLVVVSSEESVTRFFDAYQSALPRAYYTIQKDASVLYRIVAGVFDTRAAAELASASISDQMDGLKPVIVSYESIHAALND